MLAQVTNHQEAPQEGLEFVQRVWQFDPPSQGEYVDSLMTMDVALALVLLVCGLVYLLQGWKVFKMLVIINAGILGAMVGGELGRNLTVQHGAVFSAVAGSVLLAVLAWPLMKAAVSLMGGLAGAFVGYGMWSYAARLIGRPGLADYTWVGALLGLIALGLLAFIVFKAVIMVFTSLQGSVMTVSGLVAILCRLGPVREALYEPLRSNAHLLLLLIALPATIGLVFQYSALAKQAKKKKPPSE